MATQSQRADVIVGSTGLVTWHEFVFDGRVNKTSPPSLPSIRRASPIEMTAPRQKIILLQRTGLADHTVEQISWTPANVEYRAGRAGETPNTKVTAQDRSTIASERDALEPVVSWALAHYRWRDCGEAMDGVKMSIVTWQGHDIKLWEIVNCSATPAFIEWPAIKLGVTGRGGPAIPH